jgi:hypothetical protein
MKRLLLLILALTAGRGFADDVLRPPSRLHIGGFADLELRSESANLAAFDLFSTVQMSERWSGLAEVVAQKSWNSGDPTDNKIIELDLERLYASYSASDAFRLEIGQTHTGIVRWNEREHRSRFLQTPIDVPALARRPQDDGAWPLRFVGVWASGRAGGPLGFNWGAGAGAGPGSQRDAIPIFRGDRSPAAFLSLGIAPEHVRGLDLGAAVYAQHVPTKPDALRERDLSLFLNYVNNGTEIRTEWARMNHRLTRRPVSYHNTGYYLLLSKRLAGSAERVRPYVLVDHLRIDPADTYLLDASSESGWAAGLRYDFTQRFSVKGEFRSQRAPEGGRQSIVAMQLGLSF